MPAADFLTISHVLGAQKIQSTGTLSKEELANAQKRHGHRFLNSESTGPNLWKKISFGGIPNSSSIWIHIPCLPAWAPFFCAVVLPMWTMSSPKGVQNNHTAASVKVARQQTPPELSGTFRNLPEPTFRNLPEPASGTYTSTHPGTFRNCLQEPTPEHTGTLRNLPPEPAPAQTGTFRNQTLRNLLEPASGTCTSTRRNSPEPSRTCLRNLHQHTPELSDTFRDTHQNSPSGTYTSTRRNLPEPSSGTFLRNLLLRPAPAHTGAYLGWRPQ